jgi:hypothetical protein
MTAHLLAKIIRDYLAHADSITAGVPDIAIQHMDETTMEAPPRLLVRAAADDEVKFSTKVVMVVNIDLAIEDGTANQRSTLQNWMQAIRARLLAGDEFQGETFGTWIYYNVSEELRAGWKIAKMRLYPGQEGISQDDGLRLAMLSQEVRFTIHL